MRNSDVESVKNFVEEIEKFYPQAKEYLANRVGESKRGNCYPTVFYAALKNKKWGVTFPGVFDIKPSAIECPNVVNNELFATALAMKVEYMYKLGNYTYLHWARNYGYLSSHKNDWDTGFEYIRSNKNYEDEDRYLLYIPVTGNGYQFVGSFNTIKTALFVRNRYLYNILKTKRDISGEVPERRLNKYKRLLCAGYFQGLYIDFYSMNRYEVNRMRFIKIFNYVTNICEDETLNNVFTYYLKLFNRELELSDLSLLDENQKVLLQYFKVIHLSSDIVSNIVGISRNERNYVNNFSTKKVV